MTSKDSRILSVRRGVPRLGNSPWWLVRTWLHVSGSRDTWNKPYNTACFKCSRGRPVCPLNSGGEQAFVVGHNADIR